MKKISLLIVAIIIGYLPLKAQTLRVLAESDYFYSNSAFTHTDSIAYNYTGSRGGSGLSDGPINYTTAITYGFNNNTSGNSTLMQQSFDANNNITDYVYQVWDTTLKTWINNQQELSGYDALNNDTLIVLQAWDTTKAQWYNVVQASSLYTGKNLTSQITQTYDTGTKTFTKVEKDLYTTSPAGQTTNILNMGWSSSKQQWYNTSQRLWYYNAANNDTGFLDQSYDTTLQVWDDNFKSHNTFNSDSTLNNSIFYFWNSGASAWDTSERDYYYYDANKNDTLSLSDNYAGGGNWMNGVKAIFKYNAASQGTYYERFTWDGAEFVPVAEQFYYYEIFSGVSNAASPANTLVIYPNPGASIVNVQAVLPAEQPVQLALYNLQGQQVWQLNMGTAKRIAAMVPVNTLPAATYILTVKQGSFTETRQVQVVR